MRPCNNLIHIESLNYDEIKSIDKEKSIVFFPIGILENHNSHLPIGTDTYMVENAIVGLSEIIEIRNEGWKVVSFPTVNFGTQVIDELRLADISSGSYPLSSKILSLLIADICISIIFAGFKFLFVITRHGSPLHTKAIEVACDYVRNIQESKIVEYIRLGTDEAIISEALSESGIIMSKEEKEYLNNEIHAGLIETSWMLYIHPELVKSSYENLPPAFIKKKEDLYNFAKSQNFNYYFGNPAGASKEFGKNIVKIICETYYRKIWNSIKDSGFESNNGYNENKKDIPQQKIVDIHQMKRENIFYKEYEKYFDNRGEKSWI